MHSNTVDVVCIHCKSTISIQPPYSVNRETHAWIECPESKCARPNKFQFLNGTEVTVHSITKSKTRQRLAMSTDGEDKELGKLLQEVEDTTVLDRYRGAAIVLRVCLEQVVCVKLLGDPANEASVNKHVLCKLKGKLKRLNKDKGSIRDSEEAFNYLLDLGDTSAHLELRDKTRVKLPTKASVDMGIREIDRLIEVVYNW